MATVNERKVSLGTKTRPAQSTNRAEQVNDIPKRTRLSGRKNILSVENRDPDYEYYFANDVAAEVIDDKGSITLRPGQRIMELQAAGWQFVNKDEVIVGENHAYETENLGSIVRIPGGKGDYMYLMKKRKDWCEEDRALKRRDEMQQTEHQLQGYSDEEGSYGSIEIN